ncbi:MAG: hypothetical protein JWL72_4380 [Ilumatobacteraceae bacterium]|nr:hypothetical protein [Ilumatobacteraceae bacterium]
MDDSKIIDPEEFARMFEFEPSLAPDARSEARSSALFSNHGHALILVARGGELSVGELSRQMRLSEAAVGGILADLVAEQLIEQVEVGRNARFVLATTNPAASALAGTRSVAAVAKLYARRAG